MLHNYPLLILLGVALGAFGTLVGAGGGFILAPVLLLLYPQDDADTIRSISLFVVLFNAISIGAIVGARIGASLSTRLEAKPIMRALSVALGLAGIRLLLAAG